MKEGGKRKSEKQISNKTYEKANCGACARRVQPAVGGLESGRKYDRGADRKAKNPLLGLEEGERLKNAAGDSELEQGVKGKLRSKEPASSHAKKKVGLRRPTEKI